ncbi:MAG: hypothetical protein ABSA66_01855 [Roseiarcus sp.]
MQATIDIILMHDSTLNDLDRRQYELGIYLAPQRSRRIASNVVCLRRRRRTAALGDANSRFDPNHGPRRRSLE